MQFKQTTKELDANFAAVSKQLLPAVLPANESNLRLITNYLIQRHVDASGMIDASAQNIGKAITACVNALQWSIPPKKKKPVEAQGVTRILSASETLRKQNEEAEKLAKARANSEFQQSEHTKVVETLALCEELFTSYRTRRTTHSKTARLREQLREQFNSGRKLRMTPESAEALYQSLLAFADNFPG